MSDQVPPPEEPSQDASTSLPPAPGEPVGDPSRTPSAPVTSPTRNARGVVAFVVAASLIVLCAGGAMAYFKLRGAPGAVLDKVPANADAVFVAHLDPAASQKTNLFRLTEKFPDLGGREELAQRFNEMVDQALGGSAISHEDLDWIGGEAGGYADIGFGEPSFALILAADDEDAARLTLQEIGEEGGGAASTVTVSGVDVSNWTDGSSTAVFDGVAVLASDENVMRTVIDTSQGSKPVEDDAVFQGVMDRLPEDNLGFVYVNMQELVSVLGSIPTGVVQGMPSLSQLEGFQGWGMSVSAEPDGLAIDGVVTTDPSKLTEAQRDALVAGSEPTPLLSDIPADALAVLATRGAAGTSAQLGESLNQIAAVDPSAARLIRRLHLNEVLSHLTGDVAVQVGPGAGFMPVAGTLIAGIDDADAVSTWLDRTVPLLLAQGDVSTGIEPSITRQDHDGVTITSFGGTPPVQFSWAVTEDALITGLTPADVAEAIDLGNGTGDPITADPGFTEVMERVPGTSSLFYLDVRGTLDTLKSFLPPEEYQAFLDEGGRNVEPIEALVAGSSGDEHATTVRIFIEVP
jgi:hypothetical protein